MTRVSWDPTALCVPFETEAPTEFVVSGIYDLPPGNIHDVVDQAFAAFGAMLVTPRHRYVLSSKRGAGCKTFGRMVAYAKFETITVTELLIAELALALGWSGTMHADYQKRYGKTPWPAEHITAEFLPDDEVAS